MGKDKHKTIIIFRTFRSKKYGDPDVIALFPYDVDSRDGSVCSYQHVGQHSAADYHHIIRNSRLAKPTEYADLKTEMESMGYNLQIQKKMNYDLYLKEYYRARS